MSKLQTTAQASEFRGVRLRGFDAPDFLEAIQNPDHERHEELLEWIGGSFDPEAFDPAAATKAMRKGLGDRREEAW